MMGSTDTYSFDGNNGLKEREKTYCHAEKPRAHEEGVAFKSELELIKFLLWGYNYHNSGYYPSPCLI
jgi:hypothetical protein